MALALLQWRAPASGWNPVLLDYGACIASFLGALHWGRAVARDGLAAGYVWSVLPSLLAWLALLLTVRGGLLLAVLLVLCLGVDALAMRRGW